MAAARIAGPRLENTALGIWFIGAANGRVEVGQNGAVTSKVRLPMICRLAFDISSTPQAFGSGSEPNIHLLVPSKSLTKPSSDIDIFRISFLIALSSRGRRLSHAKLAAIAIARRCQLLGRQELGQIRGLKERTEFQLT